MNRAVRDAECGSDQYGAAGGGAQGNARSAEHGGPKCAEAECYARQRSAAGQNACPTDKFTFSRSYQCAAGLGR